MIKLIDIQLNTNEQHLQHLIDEFNRLCTEGNYPSILSWDHYTLFVKSNGTTPQEWKEFRLNPKIKQWYEDEQNLQLQSSLMKLLQEVGDGRSTGQAQTISAMLNQLNKLEKQESTVKYIYSFVPLTKEEALNPDVRILQDIPTEIRDAIQVIQTRPTSNGTKK